MNCKNFYSPKRPSRVRIDVNQEIHNSIDNIYEDVPKNDLSDLSDFSNMKMKTQQATVVVEVKI